MQSKKSLFNQTIFKKNLTRFAPVWVLYTLMLVIVVVSSYVNYRTYDASYQFTSCFFSAIPQGLVVLNMGYALVVAQLLFGDLYNPRLGYALHALPLTRENWFVTGVVSGLVFSLIPTFVMALAALPLLSGSLFTGAWRLAFLTMLMANLQYLCCFGLAAFSAMCVGNRFTMIAGYGLLHGGAQIAFWAVNILYTPMLYGVQTPAHPFNILTPLWHMTEKFYDYTLYDDLYVLARQRNCQLADLTGTFSCTGQWSHLWLIAGVGVLFLALALLLYRKRSLECAGDAVAFPFLRPVFQVLCTLFVTVTSWYFLRDMMNRSAPEALKYGLLAVAMIVGWFIGKMLVARSTRVFHKRNWYGLGILAAVMALSLVCTHFDVLGIEQHLPNLDKVERVTLGTAYTADWPLTDRADLNKILRLHTLAMDERIESDGLYVRGLDGTMVKVVDSNDGRYDMTQENPELTQAVTVRIYYTMKNGSTMERRYVIWRDGEAGSIAREILSRWEYVNDGRTALEDGSEVSYAEHTARNILAFSVDGERVLKEETDLSETALSFLEAVKADCAAGNMVQDHWGYHKGYFRSVKPDTSWDGEEYYQETDSIDVTLTGEGDTSWWIRVFPDSENAVRWLQDRGLLDDWELIPNRYQEWDNLWRGATEEALD